MIDPRYEHGDPIPTEDEIVLGVAFAELHNGTADPIDFARLVAKVRVATATQCAELLERRSRETEAVAEPPWKVYAVAAGMIRTFLA
jgi:hypothetical protein